MNNNDTKPACPKCSGFGVISRFLDNHNGVCFDCGGSGAITTQPTSELSPTEAAHVEITSLWKIIRASKNDPEARYAAEERKAQINAELRASK